jgi:outer membrane protein OmpU
MKKILLATSVLAATTGFAAAEVTVSGSARMGLVYQDATNDVVFSSRVRVKFEMVGTTDGGLEFGASVRADQSGGNSESAVVGVGPDGLPGTLDDVVTTLGSSGTSNGDSTVYVKSGAFKLTMGDVGGAADSLVGQVSGVGYGPNDALQEIDFIGTTKTAVYAEYTAGALTFGIGAGQTSGAGEYNVGIKYATDAYSVALGYEDDGTDTQTSLAGSATFSAATVKVKLVDDSTNTDLQYALSVDYALGATTLTGFYTDFGDLDKKHIGLGAAYDLGGGASIKGGIVQQDLAGVKTTFADVGIVMSF